MAKTKLLVVDDDENLLTVIQHRLEYSGYHVVAASHEDEARKVAKEQSFDVAILDLKLVAQDGITLMEELHTIQPHLPVIILTGHNQVKTAVDAMKRGAHDYLTKPFESAELINHIEHITEQQKLSRDINKLQAQLEVRFDVSQIIATSPVMDEILAKIRKVAATESNVAIYGESGTGKEMIAKAIHDLSPRKGNPLLAINCAAIPETLLESELFGYEKGAFTGADKSSRGLFGRADKGTLFLDEIGDMHPATQAKLLRVLQEQQFVPLGGEQPITVDVRVIVATNKDLQEEVKNGRFRKDLYYRVHVIPIELPPLHMRKEDIPLLVDHFITKYAKLMKKKISGITPEAMQKLILYDWPGNIRELQNTIEYAIAMAPGNKVSDDLILHSENSQDELLSLQEARARFEQDYLENILKITGGNVTKAAELAGKYRADMYNLMKKHNISPHDFKR